MSNDLTTTGASNLALPTEGPNVFAAAAADMGALQGNFLKFSGNDGNYTFGPAEDSQEIEHGSQLAVNMATFKRGYICWVNGEVVEEIMIPVVSGLPIPLASSLADFGPYQTYEDGTKDGWREQGTIELRDLENGDMFLLKLTSKGGILALGALSDAFSKVYRQKVGFIPVIELGAVSFEPKVKTADGSPSKKKIGKKYAPTLKIVGWIPDDEYLELIERSSAAHTDAEDADDGSEDPKNYQTTTTVIADRVSQGVTQKVTQEVAAEPVAEADKVVVGRRNKRF